MYTIRTAPVEVEGKEGPVTVDVPFVVFFEKTEHTAQGVVIGGRSRAKPKVTDTVKGWLNGHLESAGGYAPADDVLTAATAQGYSRSTVHRARQQLGLRIVLVGQSVVLGVKGALSRRLCQPEGASTFQSTRFHARLNVEILECCEFSCKSLKPLQLLSYRYI